jgi:hypothetical protein
LYRLLFAKNELSGNVLGISFLSAGCYEPILMWGGKKIYFKDDCE